MWKYLIIAILFTGSPTETPVRRDAKISKKEMEKSLDFVRKDASTCRRQLSDFRTCLAKLNKERNKKKEISKK